MNGYYKRQSDNILGMSKKEETQEKNVSLLIAGQNNAEGPTMLKLEIICNRIASVDYVEIDMKRLIT